jgi:hypothetical protein
MTAPPLLTEQFYQWERRGRGWQVWPEPFDLEPAFRAFLGGSIPSPATNSRICSEILHYFPFAVPPRLQSGNESGNRQLTLDR